MQLYNISEKGELINLEKLDFEENDVYLVDDKEKNTIYIWVGLKVAQEKKDITADIARKLDKVRGGSAKILIMKQKREYGTFLAMMHDLERGRIPGITVERRPELILEEPLEIIEPVIAQEPQAEIETEAEKRIKAWLTQLKEHRKIEYQKTREKAPSKFIPLSVEKHPVMIETKDKIQLEKEVEQVKEYKTYEPEEIKEPEEPELKTQVREAAYYLSQVGYTYDELCWMLAEKIQKMNLEMPSIEDIRKKAEEVFKSSCSYDELCWLNAEMDILTKRSLLEEKKREMFQY